jgi:hypothetical protein
MSERNRAARGVAWVVLALLLPGAAAAQEAATTRALTEAYGYLIPCQGPPEAYGPIDCRTWQRLFMRNYQAAMAGDLEGQRAVAGTLAAGGRAVATNPLQACAWRSVALLSGHPRVGTEDARARDAACDPLTASEREAAAARARAILERIRTEPARMPPPWPG